MVEHAPECVPGLGIGAATSTASLMAIPSEPGLSGSASTTARPAAVRVLGERWTCPPKASIMRRRYGFWSKLAPTCQISHSRPKSAQAKARAVPHWPAPVSVVRRRMPARAL